MLSALNPLSFVIACLAGWLSEHQQRCIEYLTEENRVLREQIGDKKLRFTDDQRRRLAVRAKELSRSVLNRVASIATPETLLAWHRKFISIPERFWSSSLSLESHPQDFRPPLPI
jgi:hypothetical protein